MDKIKRLIPNLLTAGNLVGGILAIIFALTGRIDLSPWCIFASAIFDFLDGFAARLLKVQNELGKQLDSLADMVTFGVAPGVMIYVLLLGGGNPGYLGMVVYNNYMTLGLSSEMLKMVIDWIPFTAFFVPVFALFRLAKFNLDTRQTSSFIGLPTPAMTLFFTVIPIVGASAIGYGPKYIGELSEWEKWIGVNILLHPIFLAISSIVMSILMVSEIPLFALKFKGFGWTENKIRYVFLTMCLIMFATLLFWSIPLIIILYIILSVINNAINKTNEI